MHIKGIAHIHTNYSDGNFSLEEAKNEAKKIGMSFVLLSEHTNDDMMSSSQYDKVKQECKRLSDKHFLMVSGIEVIVKRGWHILIYNSPIYIPQRTFFDKLVSLIKQAGARDYFIAMAHARLTPRNNKPNQSEMMRFDAIEVWNTKYDTSHAPCLSRLRWLRGLSKPKAISGIDAHSVSDLKKLWLEMEVSELSVKNIFDNLKAGSFITRNGYMRVDLNKEIGFFQNIWFARMSWSFAVPMNFMRILARKGVKLPKWCFKLKQKAL